MSSSNNLRRPAECSSARPYHDTICGFCFVNMRNVPEELLVRVDAYFKPSIHLTRHFLLFWYCSEYCMIQDYVFAVGQNNYAACVAKVLEKNPAFDHEAYSRIGARRGARMYQVLPPPYDTGKSSNKAARTPVDGMTD